MHTGDRVYLAVAAATAIMVCALALAGGAAVLDQTTTTTYATSTIAAMPPVIVCLLASAVAKASGEGPSIEAVFMVSFATAFSAFWPLVICSQQNIWCGQHIKYQYISSLSGWLLAFINVYLL